MKREPAIGHGWRKFLALFGGYLADLGSELESAFALVHQWTSLSAAGANQAILSRQMSKFPSGAPRSPWVCLEACFELTAAVVVAWLAGDSWNRGGNYLCLA